MRLRFAGGSNSAQTLTSLGRSGKSWSHIWYVNSQKFGCAGGVRVLLASQKRPPMARRSRLRTFSNASMVVFPSRQYSVYVRKRRIQKR
jgi:hypothetical protein